MLHSKFTPVPCFVVCVPYGLANQKLCYIQILLNVERPGDKAKNVLKNGRWIQHQLYQPTACFHDSEKDILNILEKKKNAGDNNFFSLSNKAF